MKLRVFDLPLESGDGQTIPDKQIGGWSWFEPCHDPEKLAFVTDAGYVGLFGINQPGNQDEAVFALNREPIRLGSNDSHLVRGQVIHAQDNDFWIVAGGRLQRYYFRRSASSRCGIAAWPADGSPRARPSTPARWTRRTRSWSQSRMRLGAQVTLATAVINKGKVRKHWARDPGYPGSPGNANPWSIVGAFFDGAATGPAGGWQISDSLLRP